MSNKISWHKLEKHDTKDIHDNHINGFLIPVWRNWDKIITVQPEMVYVTRIEPGERKGPHLHIIRHSYYVCIKGTVVFIIKNKDGKYILMVVDGRQPGSRGVDLNELSILMYDLDCYEAINLDGGGSSALVVNGKLLNKPAGFNTQREVMSAIAVFSE